MTVDSCLHVEGPFFHGTKAVLEIGAELEPGYGSNFQEGRTSNNIYLDRGRIYVVEPLGPFEDDPNVTNKRFPGNPTRSYRSRHALRIVDEVVTWQGHDPEVLDAMLESLRVLREQGRDLIED